MTEWIFCKDRLPDRTGDYLVIERYQASYSDPRYSLQYELVTYILPNDGPFQDGWCVPTPDEILCWMPLPVLPEVEE